MKIKIETSPYNERRYGKPWIAKVDFTTSKGEFQWGEWVGQAGCSGILLLDAHPGDVVARGQRDNRKMSNSAPDFYVVEADMTLRGVSKAEAYEHYHAPKVEAKPKDTAEALLREAYTQLAKLNGDSVACEINNRIAAFLEALQTPPVQQSPA